MDPEVNWGEIYFIAAMMVLILILCVASVWIFFRTYKKEMRERAERQAKKSAAAETTGDKH